MGRLLSSTPFLLVRAAVVCAVLLGTSISAAGAETRRYDVVVYGGTSAGVIAAVQAARMGKTVALVSPDRHLGGLSSGGLGWTDTGNKAVIGGLAREFYHRVWLHYQDPQAWKWQRAEAYGNRGQGTPAIDGANRTMWIFEPHVAEQVFETLVAEHPVELFRGQWLDRERGVEKEGQRIVAITTLSGETFAGRVFIDATYEGDLLASAGVSYHVGREGQEVYDERWAGVQTGVLHHRHHFGVVPPISPHREPGDPESGLLPLVSSAPPGEYGQGDHRVQAYCFRMCLTDHPENRVPFPKPEGYDPARYELLARVLDAGWDEAFQKFDPIPNRKTDTNNHGPVSTDFIGGNYDYPEADYERRREIIAEHRRYQQGLMYFLANDARVPAAVREKVSRWGLAKDEFVDNDHWPHQIYVREARRMIGSFVMTENELLKRRPTPQSVGMGSYTIDSHNVQRYVTPDGYVQNEGDIGVPTPGPYEIAYGALLPRREQCTNLLVPVCVSSSHIAFGSIRMEPVFMILGQSAATAATLAIEADIDLQDVDYEDLRERLEADGQVLEYEYKGKGLPREGLEGIVLDDLDAEQQGSWQRSTANQPHVSFGYLHDNDARDGKAEVRYETEVERAGDYQLRVIYAPAGNRATNVPVTVEIGDRREVHRLNQRQPHPKGGASTPLGVYQCDSGTKIRVTISNRGTDGYVVADAIQLVAVEQPLAEEEEPATAEPSTEAAEPTAGNAEPTAGDAARNSGADRVSFNRDIRPLLSDRCFACHGPDESTREAGLRLDLAEGAYEDRGGYQAVEPGNAEASEILARMTSDDPGMVMPPPEHGEPLGDEQLELVRRWIDQGAEYQAHWAFVPVRRPSVPAVAGLADGAHPIDAFVTRGIREAGLTANPPAEPRTLVRRLAFDLTGLPPKPEWVRSFTADPSEANYRALVDEMLASPHYGERMALYWLDLVRYADTLGYHGDQVRSVWPYRDWVIRAFNENMPFDQFTIEQLAGDLLPDATLMQKVASTYNRLNRASGEGGVQPKEYLAKYSADRVRTTGAVWLGTTLGCAECHDHKFDPYTTKNFYQFAAFFADIKEQGIVGGANHIAKLPVPSPQQSDRLRQLRERHEQLTRQLEEATAGAGAAYEDWLQRLNRQTDVWRGLVPSKADAASDAGLAVGEDGSVLASGTNPDKDVYTLRFAPNIESIGALRLELIPHPSLPAKGPGRASNGNLVLNKLELRQGERTATWTFAAASHTQAQHDPRYLIDGNPRGWAILPQVGQSLSLVLAADQPLQIDPAGGPVQLRIEQNFGGGHNLGHFRVAVSARTASELPTAVTQPGLVAVAAKAEHERSDAEQQRLRGAFQRQHPPTQALLEEIATVDQSLQRLRAEIPTTLASRTTEPRTIRVLPRGNWMDDSGPVVQPAVPGFLAEVMDMSGFPKDRRLTRLDLARWLTRPDNPLVARTMVNRLWMLMFGRGIAPSVDDLGSQGTWPSHPELLDWLAAEYVSSGWDTKAMIRAIVLSDAYRRSSRPTAEQRRLDPYNRWLARQSRWRLEAEMVRDNALSVSGLLVPTIGGESVRPYQPAGYWSQLNFPKRTYQHDRGAAQYRRGLYTHWQRTFLHPSLLAFDAPAREECTAQRSRSNTPLQSLVLLNDPTYVEAARVLAVRLLEATPQATPVERYEWLYRRVLQRSPREPELRVLNDLRQRTREEFVDQPQRAAELLTVGLAETPETVAPRDVASWMAVTRALLNLHETITRY